MSTHNNDSTAKANFEKWDGEVNHAFAVRDDLSTTDYYDIGSLKLEQAEVILMAMLNNTDEPSPCDAVIGILHEAGLAFRMLQKKSKVVAGAVADQGAQHS